MVVADQVGEHKFVRLRGRTTARSVGPDMDYHSILPGRIVQSNTTEATQKAHFQLECGSCLSTTLVPHVTELYKCLQRGLIY